MSDPTTGPLPEGSKVKLEATTGLRKGNSEREADVSETDDSNLHIRCSSLVRVRFRMEDGRPRVVRAFGFRQRSPPPLR